MSIELYCFDELRTKFSKGLDHLKERMPNMYLEFMVQIKEHKDHQIKLGELVMRLSSVCELIKNDTERDFALGVLESYVEMFHSSYFKLSI